MKLSDTQDVYMPDPNEEDEVECGVCGVTMIAHRDCHGPTSYTMAMAGSSRNHDYFECPYRKEDWHKKVIDIRQYMIKVPSDALCNVMKMEINQILNNKWQEKSGVDPSGKMWLLPRMHKDANKVQKDWEGSRESVREE